MYTLRNGRKQYILEVSEDNVNNFGSGRVQIPPELTLTLHVEYVSLCQCISCELRLNLSFTQPRSVARQPTLLQPQPPPSQFLTTPTTLQGAAVSQLASPATSEAASPALAPAEASTRKRSRAPPDTATNSTQQSPHDPSMQKRQKVDDFHPG